MKTLDEVMDEAADLARLAFDAKDPSSAVIVWHSGSNNPEEVIYLLEGWDDKQNGWRANDTHSPTETFKLGDIADAMLVRRFMWFLLGKRGGISLGETLDDDAQRFSTFERVGGQFGKYRLLLVSSDESNN